MSARAISKTLVIAEKPSVARDLARALPGPFARAEGYLEGPGHIVTWAVGHLVALADPERYDERYKRWQMADLPILPERFKLDARDARAAKQLRVVKAQLHRADVAQVINACDAGREGELIFAYLYEKAAAKKPVARLWLSSMTAPAIKAAFGQLRDARELAPLEAAARSRSEADWILGMNATRAATIKLRASFDGAVSLGRVQTPTLAILARREAEIRDFKPEPYWVIDAVFAPTSPPRPRLYCGRFHAAPKLSGPRLKTAAQADAVINACKGQTGEITKLQKAKRSEPAPLLYDLTSLQRDANARFGFSAERTLAGAQRLYEQHKALTYPRTDSRYLTSDMVGELAPIAALLGAQREYAQAARYVLSLSALPLARVVADAKVADHHAIIPTRSQHPVAAMNADDRRIYDLVARRFLAAFHPDAEFEHTLIETTVAGAYVFATRGKLMLKAGWRAVYGESADAPSAAREDDDDRGAEQQLPKLAQGERVAVHQIAAERKLTKAPPRYSEGRLLGAMQTAGRLVDDEQLREAMKECGIGTPATRAAIIERLLAVAYIKREARVLVVTEKGMGVIAALGEHPLASPSLTGEWERRLARIESGEDSRAAFMADIATFAAQTVSEFDAKLQSRNAPAPAPAPASVGKCPGCGAEVVENRKGYSCWTSSNPGCGFVIWKSVAGKALPVTVIKELIATGHTRERVSGFRSRAGKSFAARLALTRAQDGKWQVSFDEPWARRPAPASADGEQSAPAPVAGKRVARRPAAKQAANPRRASARKPRRTA